MTEPLNAWPPERTVFKIAGIEMRVAPGRHRLEALAAAEIAENWAAEVAANPALFNGEVLLPEEMVLREGVIHATARATGFATTLWWRKQVSPTEGLFLNASAVPISADGLPIAIRMAPHTANAGKVYFATGSLDLSDVRDDGTCDVLGSMTREVLEETGIDLKREATAEPALYAVHFGRRFFVFRFFHLSESAEQICRRVERHMQGETEPEIDAVFALTADEGHAHRYHDLTPIILAFFFARRMNAAG
ncbi:hypothetical protein SAMN05880590_105161 [Rhizobium sp. RU35A]|uniref:NUDIX hydrolase n=1 Tax=Rhizobium sp. RU35A TaxID=1907414 RepID=UPI000953A8AF|nr:NUDIX hydrolase [Rhizobium sp. RU35A]SIQ56203.1 hypothetical protein SAMN05880590_105161 [Rhizobium sp. RU35A]